MKTRMIAATSVVVAIVVAVVLLPEKSAVDAPETKVAQRESKAAAPAETPAVPAEENPDQVTEQQKMNRMIHAHAPLRTPEIADPDSSENQERLQKMILNVIPKETDEK